MSDDLTREHLETSKQRAIVYREWGYFALVALVAAMLVWTLWSFRNAQNMVGATNAAVTGVIGDLRLTVQELNSKLSTVNAGKINQRLDDLGKSQDKLTVLIDHLDKNTGRLTDASIARINQVGDNLASLKAVTDNVATLTLNTNRSLNGEGGILPNLALLANTFNTRTTELAGAITDAINEGKLTVRQAKKLLEDQNIPAILAELKGSMANLNATTGKVAEGFNEYPAMMKAWRKYSEAAATWQKRIYLVRLLAIIAGIPGLL